MRILMLRTAAGPSSRYLMGQEYEVPEALAIEWCRQHFAKAVGPAEATDGPMESMMLEPGPETAMLDHVPRKRGRPRKIIP